MHFFVDKANQYSTDEAFAKQIPDGSDKEIARTKADGTGAPDDWTADDKIKVATYKSHADVNVFKPTEFG